MGDPRLKMGTLRELTAEEIKSILSKGTFGELVSTVEHVELECKSGVYDTKSAKSKIELAKDVSALANSKGGFLLLGPVTIRNPLHHGDEITSVSEFASSLFQPDAYRDILNALVYPRIPNLKIEWHSSSADPLKGIGSIYVPAEAVSERPFVVAQSEIDSQIRGHLFGYFERAEDDALPTTVQTIRDMMKDGKRYGELERRLDNLEALLGKLVSNRSPKQDPFRYERLFQRAADARIAAQLLDVPSFFLLSAPLQPIKLSGLFSSKSAEHEAITNPPAYRQHGFDVNPHTPVQYVRGELIRRVTQGRKGLELWQDGTLIFVGRNDEDFLGWAVRRRENKIYINNYVLTEVVALFFTLAIGIYDSLQQKPEKVKVFFGFLADEPEGTLYELSHLPISRQVASFRGGTVPAENKWFEIDFDLQGAVPEVEALKMLKEIYHWFGITDENIPYVDSNSSPQRVDRRRYAPE